jgi:hypothetical protein
MATISRSEVVWIAPDCPPDVDAMIRREAAAKGQQVMPAQPFPWNRKATDQKTVAERKWRAGSKAAKPQKPCDVGLFSDDADQLKLV